MASAQMEILLNEISSHPFIFDFNQEGLGDWMCEIAASAIRDYMDAETDWDGANWPDLSEAYAAWKSDHYPGLRMGELDMIMKGSDQLIGTVTVQGQEMHQLYGTSEEAQQHSVWFQEGNPGVQPPRPFYALNALAIANLDAMLDQWFIDHLR